MEELQKTLEEMTRRYGITDWSIMAGISDKVTEDGAICKANPKYLSAVIDMGPDTKPEQIRRILAHECGHILLAEMTWLIDAFAASLTVQQHTALMRIIYYAEERVCERLANGCND